MGIIKSVYDLEDGISPRFGKSSQCFPRRPKWVEICCKGGQRYFQESDAHSPQWQAEQSCLSDPTQKVEIVTFL